MIRWNAIWSVMWRNMQSYFSGALGYLVIVVFVTVAAFCAFSPRFFANNLANLDQLSAMFPLLLLAVVPAITMGTWADEKKQGTDEILFTLPATDLEIMLGKYFSVLSVYTIVLAFSLTKLIALAWIGDPDWGVIFTTYVGYWLAGAAMLSVGMFASVLTGSTTVAYVLGATLCAIPVLIGTVAPGNNFVQGLSLSWQLRDFTAGMIPLTGVLYFFGLSLFMLYLNLVVISRRHWGHNSAMGLQYTTRSIALGIALISICFMASKSTAQFFSHFDLTQERLFTLSDTTRKTIEQAIEKERAITIQAFVSPDIPRDYVYPHKQLVNLLRQYDRLGGGNVDVRFVNVEANSKEAREARTLGIEPIKHKGEIGGKLVEQDVYLGAVVTSNLDEAKLPVLDGENSMEFELTRAISTVTTREDKLKIGVLETDILRLDEQRMFRVYDRLIAELQQQYKLVNVDAARLTELARTKAEQQAEKKKQEGDEDKDPGVSEEEKDDEEEEEDKNKPDILLVAQPSSLTQSRMDDLLKYIQQGHPVLMLDDPLPVFPFVFYRPEDIGIINAPRQTRPAPNSPFSWVSSVPEVPLDPEMQMQMQQMQQQLQRMPPQFAQQMMDRFFEENPRARPKFEPKGDISSFLSEIGISWNTGRVAWDSYEGPQFTPRWQTEMLGESWPASFGRRQNMFMFLGRESKGGSSFGTSPISSGLQEMLFFYAGAIQGNSDSESEFVPLIQTGVASGVMSWNDVTVESEENSRFTNAPIRRIAKRPIPRTDEKRHVIAAHVKSKAEQDKINVVFVADLDFVTDLYFQQQEEIGSKLDNLNFIFNAIETLIGDASLIQLRDRRPKPHRLVKIQDVKSVCAKERADKSSVAEEAIKKKLIIARDRLKNATKEIGENEELGFFQKMQMEGMAASTEQRRFDREKEKLDRELEITIEELKSTEQSKVDRYESWTRTAAVMLPALPALLLGIFVMGVRKVGEYSRVTESRRH